MTTTAPPPPYPRRLRLVAAHCRVAAPSSSSDDRLPSISAVKTEWRRLPPLGGAPSNADAARLQAPLARLEERVAALELAGQPLAVDARVMTKAVRWALQFDEFWEAARYLQEGDTAIDAALRCLVSADTRLGELEANPTALTTSWHAAAGFVVRGYTSSVDSSPQPFGLVLPENLTSAPEHSLPLYVWLHGRGDELTDLHFIARCLSPGRGQAFGGLVEAEATTSSAVVLHPFGRSCLGYKSAAETDVYESIQAVLRLYPAVDPDRVVLAGFSMGGSGAYHIAAHRPDQWAAVHIGAAFAETYLYTSGGGASGGANDQSDKPWYEKQLWGLYDTPCYAGSLANLGGALVGYNGDADSTYPQQTGLMEDALAAAGGRYPLIIAPGVGHEYEPAALTEVMRRLKRHAAAGRDDSPDRVQIQTQTLRYARVCWLAITGLVDHWADAQIEAVRVHPTFGHAGSSSSRLQVATKGVVSFTADPAPSFQGVTVEIDGKVIPQPTTAFDPSLPAAFVLSEEGEWSWTTPASEQQQQTVSLTKQPGLQGPIDDAFMSTFAFVSPAASATPTAVDSWINFELDHAVHRWEAVFRGTPTVHAADQLTEADLAAMDCNIVLWGTPATNHLIATLFDDSANAHHLPLSWGAETAVTVGSSSFPSASHVPLLVYPSPWAPGRYVVLNSGVTHREEDDRTNALQNPKLPDWAVVDITTPPTGDTIGRVAAADFFDEQWQLKP